jgi:hypothetical protein
MTAPSHRQAPRYTSEPDPHRKFELTVARREDVRRLAASGPPDDELPPVHATKGDPRYPATTDLRHVLAFFIELLLHLSVGAAVLFLVAQQKDIRIGLLAGVGAFFALSIIDRIIVQRIFHASVGKMITGLYLIRDDNGEAPTVGPLVKEWFRSIGAALSLLNT